MMEGWKEYKLKELTETINRGVTPKYVEENGHVVINQKCIRNNYLSFSEARLTSKAKKISEYKKVNLGDVLVNSTGTGTLGRTAFVKKLPAETTTVDTHVTIVRPSKLVDNRFLGYNLGFQEPQIENYAKGATNQQELGRDDLGLLKIHLPPLPTQRKIAKILSAYDDLIETNLKRIKLLEEMAQITYEEWFVRMKFPGHETAKFDEKTGLPVGWEMVKLGEVCEFKYGKMPKKQFKNKIGYPIYSGYRITGYYPEYLFEEATLIVVARGVGGTGDVKISPQNCWLTNLSIAVLVKNGIYQNYLYYHLKDLNLRYLDSGAAQSQITINSLKNVFIINPQKYLQNSFNGYIVEIFREIENLQQQNQRLKESRDILLPRLMTGMIDVEKINSGL